MTDDLGDVLRNLNRRTRDAQRRLANHPLTRAYLDAGMRLLEKRFSVKAADDELPEHQIFLSMSRDQVINEVAHGSPDLPHRGTVGSFRDRWALFPDYLGDLISYALRPYRWRDHTKLAEQAADAIGGDNLSDVVHEIAYRDVEYRTRDTARRFQLLVTALADCNPTIATALSAVYGETAEAWRAVYAKFFHTRSQGLWLRPGVSLDDFTVLLTAVAEGLALRKIGDGATPVLDHQRRCSLLGTAVIALVIAFVDPGDGETLEDAFDRMADRR